MELSNYDIFIRKYNLCMTALLDGKLEKAHKLLISCMEYFQNYMYETDGIYKVKALRFSKELCALERQIAEKTQNLKENKNKCKSDVLLSNICGLDFVKEELKRLIIYPQVYPELYTKYKKAKGGGILLYGVPGTGKTWIAKEVAKEIDAHFIEVKCSSVISKWFGESEKNIKGIFDEARKYDCSIIFFDEFEALGAVRGKETNGPIGRIVSELLSQMQGFDSFDNTVIVMAATNRPWDIDTAFLRPGRFSNLIHIPLPDDVSRKEIILSELDSMLLSADFNLTEMVSKTNGFNRADVVELCERLKDEVIMRVIKTNSDELITNDDLNKTLKLVASSVRNIDLEKIEKYNNNLKN